MIDDVGIRPFWNTTRTSELLLIFTLLLVHPAQAQQDQAIESESPVSSDVPATDVPATQQSEPPTDNKKTDETPERTQTHDARQSEPVLTDVETDTEISNAEETAESSASVESSVEVPVELSAADMLRESRLFYRSERLPEALDMAEQLVAYEAARQPPNSPELILPVLNLADVQRVTGAEGAALQNYDRAVDLIERDGGVFDERLIEPLLSAARIMSGNGQHEGAGDIFLRAQHVIHRDDGVYSVNQLEALDDMTINYLAMGDYETANKVQIFSLNIARRAYQDQPRRIVAANVKFANFKKDIGHFDQARRIYLDMIKYMEKTMDTNDLQMVTVVQGLGAVGMHEQRTGVAHTSSVGASGYAAAAVPNLYMGRKAATRALERTVQIMENYPNDVTIEERADAYLDLGDWYLLISEREKGFAAYQVAWDLLANAPNSEELLARAFGQPKQLRYSKPALPTLGAGRHENYDGTYVALQFDVDALGNVNTVTIVDSNTPLRMRNRMRHQLKRALYRPKFEDGKPVAASGLQFRETFAGTAYVIPD